MALRVTQRHLALLILLAFGLWCVASVVWGVPLTRETALSGQPPGSYAIGTFGFLPLLVDAVIGVLAVTGFIALGRRLPT